MLSNSSAGKLASLLFAILFTTAALAQNKNLILEQFYKAMSSDDMALIEKELIRLEKLGEAAEMAYQGALIMKKAGLMEQVNEKLETFKKGKQMLDKAIAARPENGEFRFLTDHDTGKCTFNFRV